MLNELKSIIFQIYMKRTHIFGILLSQNKDKPWYFYGKMKVARTELTKWGHLMLSIDIILYFLARTFVKLFWQEYLSVIAYFD